MAGGGHLYVGWVKQKKNRGERAKYNSHDDDRRIPTRKWRCLRGQRQRNEETEMLNL